MRNSSLPGEFVRQGAESDDSREASLPPQPRDDVHARVTRPVGDDVFARATMPGRHDVHARPTVQAPPPEDRATVPGGVDPATLARSQREPVARPTVPGVYPGIAAERERRNTDDRETAVEVRRITVTAAPEPRLTAPIASMFAPAAALPFTPTPPAPEPSSPSLTPVSTSAAPVTWSAATGSALPVAPRRRRPIAVLAVGLAIAVGCAAALIGRSVRKPEAAAATPPAMITVTPPPATAAPPEATAEPTAEAAPAPAPTAPAASPRARPKQAAAAPRPQGAPRAPNRPFDVQSD